MKKLVFTFFSFLTATTLIYAVDWTGNSDGNWNIGSNWTGGAVPGSGDAVFIRTSDTVYQNAQNREMGRLSLGITSGGTTHLTPTLNVGEFGGSLTTGVGPTNTADFGEETVPAGILFIEVLSTFAIYVFSFSRKVKRKSFSFIC